MSKVSRYRLYQLLVLLFVLFCSSLTVSATTTEQSQFKQAWQAASKGNRQAFQRHSKGLENYVLFPYLRYEELRHNRHRVPASEMATFLSNHQDWAFYFGLRTTWLKSLGQNRRWSDLRTYAGDEKDTEVQCYLARALLNARQLDGLLEKAQMLWTAGKSQPKACDPLFNWLKSQGGITHELAWKRIGLAMEAGNPRLSLYLARFIPASDRIWVNRWQSLSQRPSTTLRQARSWSDESYAWEMVAQTLKRQARSDADFAWQEFQLLDRHFNWPESIRGPVLRDIALYSAVALAPDALQRLQQVPADNQDGQLLEWWTRAGLGLGDWQSVLHAISLMPDDKRNDSRWRYWRARALDALGDTEVAQASYEALAREANYHGFLSADHLGQNYNICPIQPTVGQEHITQIRQRPDIERALELRAVDMDNWANREWALAVRRLSIDELRTAAAIAVDEGWHYQAIVALGNSGDLRFYDWRFPLHHQPLVDNHARNKQLDPSWVMALIRSESAMLETAISSAGARGLMQVTPDTARSLSRRHGIPYQGRSQLLRAEDNVRFGTTFLRELLTRFSNNPVLVAGAYNAGPHVVDRWLADRPILEPAIWVETLPYFETRDYIPRVLAFSTIYAWRMQQPIPRISSRMPGLNSQSTAVPTLGGTVASPALTQVVCPVQG